jgi:hypothetical protein
MIVTEDRALIQTAFTTIDPACLDVASDTFLDALSFGVVGLSPAGNTEIYNAALVRFAGVKRDTVLGQPLYLVLAG